MVGMPRITLRKNLSVNDVLDKLQKSMREEIKPHKNHLRCMHPCPLGSLVAMKIPVRHLLHQHISRGRSLRKNDVNHRPVTHSLTSLGNESIFIGSYNPYIVILLILKMNYGMLRV
jgi:hypothetical protein